MISGCGIKDYVREKTTGERYGDPVAGPRRPPVLNPGYQAYRQAEAKAKQQAAAAAAARQQQGGAGSTPYDQYDATGNRTDRRNLIGEWAGGDKPAAAQRSAGPVRKSFKGVGQAPASVSGAISEDSPATRPVVLKPGRKSFGTQLNRQAEEEVVTTTSTTTTTTRATAASPMDVSLPPDVAAPEPAIVPPASEPMTDAPENGVYLPEWPQESSRRILPDGTQYAQALCGGGESGEAPHLSSVPQVPQEMEAIRAGKEENMQELQMQHDTAMEEKKRLLEEPTDLPPPMPTPAQVDGRLAAAVAIG